MIFDSLDFSWSILSKKFKSLISHLNSSSDLIIFQRFLKKFSHYPWIQPLLTIILINLQLNHKISEYGNLFDTKKCVFNNRIKLFCQRCQQKEILHVIELPHVREKEEGENGGLR